MQKPRYQDASTDKRREDDHTKKLFWRGLQHKRTKLHHAIATRQHERKQHTGKQFEQRAIQAEAEHA